ncbi:hypothetical protein Tco_0310989, partial [Tanacetum coccineum]
SNNVKASDIAPGQAKQAEHVVGQDGSGGSGVGQMSNAYCLGVRAIIERLIPQKRTPTQPASQPLTYSQVKVTETRNTNGREIGSGIPTQSSATADASEWAIL